MIAVGQTFLIVKVFADGKSLVVPIQLRFSITGNETASSKVKITIRYKGAILCSFSKFQRYPQCVSRRGIGRLNITPAHHKVRFSNTAVKIEFARVDKGGVGELKRCGNTGFDKTF